jgi:hypothetical protein
MIKYYTAICWVRHPVYSDMEGVTRITIKASTLKKTTGQAPSSRNVRKLLRHQQFALGNYEGSCLVKVQGRYR